MNTQAHLLLAAAILTSRPNAEPNKALVVGGHDDGSEKFQWWKQLAIILGALIPDISLYVMFVQARIRGISHDVIWSELYFSSFWQSVGAINNSIPLFLGLLILGAGLRRYHQAVGTTIVLFSMAAILHCLTDLPLHVDDGHPHFWPLTHWIYASQVSYWDPNHYGQYWLMLEIAGASICTWLLWRRFQSLWMRLFASAALLSYPIMLLFWAFTTS